MSGLRRIRAKTRPFSGFGRGGTRSIRANNLFEIEMKEIEVVHPWPELELLSPHPENEDISVYIWRRRLAFQSATYKYILIGAPDGKNSTSFAFSGTKVYGNKCIG